MTTAARLADWFLTAAERGNPATRLDARRGDGLAWAMVGSDNFNRRSWTHDSELSCAVLDEAPVMAGPQAASPQAAGRQDSPVAAGPQDDPDGRPPALRRAGTF